jgi:hypothetical protein
MEHEHGSEYRLKIVLSDGTEDLTVWLAQEEILDAITASRSRAKALWLQERKVLCGSCPDREATIQEYPIAHSDSQRYRPHDSRYLVAAGVRNRGEVSGAK